MSKKFVIVTVLILSLSFAAGFAVMTYVLKPRNIPADNATAQKGKQSSNKSSKDNEALNNQHTQPAENTDPIKEKIKGMALDEKIGQMIMVGIDGYDSDNNSRKLIEDYHVGGFVLLNQNVKNTDQLLKLINSLKSANASCNKLPLFISVDEEGGKVDRMPRIIERYPTNEKIGSINNGSLSYNIGKSLADEIKAFGFNMDLAPVLDIKSNPRNTVIGNRAFGSKPDVVSKLGVQTMLGIQSENIIPVVKHFPGHGDTSTDSHKGLPVVNYDLERLKGFELLPFTAAVKNNADAVMVAHILLPKLDSSNPASLSKTMITDILRNQMGFHGVVITDDMTMGAIVKNYNIGESAVKSVVAGADIILVCNGFSNKLSVLDSIKAAVSSGAISEKRIDESVYRILKLKNKYKLSDTSVQSVDINKINSQINSVLKGMK